MLRRTKSRVAALSFFSARFMRSTPDSPAIDCAMRGAQFSNIAARHIGQVK
jgi:hypothetical protein